MSQINEQLARLSPEERQALLAQLLRKKAQEPKSAPVSFSQARMWFAEQLAPDSLERIALHIRFNCPLDIAALGQSLAELTHRHETLRTTFKVVEGQPVQIIAPPRPTTLPLVDLRHLPQEAREAEVQRLAVASTLDYYDLNSGPLFRVCLMLLGDKEYSLLLTLHHLIADGWSISVLHHELLTLYQAFAARVSCSLPELPIQYSDFARWQREKLQSGAWEEQVVYWKRRLADRPPLLELPADRPRLRTQTLRGFHYPLHFSQLLSKGLEAIGQQERCTLFMTLLAAFQALLYRYTGQEDISVGTTVTNRDHSELERLIGPLINLLVLRTNLSENPTFRELLGRVREVTLEGFAHRDVPFEELVKELYPVHGPNRERLYQVMMVLQNMPLPQSSGEDVKVISLPVSSSEEALNAELGLFLWNLGEGLSGFIEYSSDLFDKTTIARMAGHFSTLLEGIVACPDQRLSDLPLLPQAEAHQLLVAWNAKSSDHPQHHCFAQLFEAQVERMGNATAAVCKEQRLSYSQLNRLADRLAARLVEMRVGPDVVVGLLAERGLEFLTAMIGVFKAGGAYLPLDPRHPIQRQAQVLSSSGTRLVLATETFMPVLRQVNDLLTEPLQVLMIENMPSDLDGREEDELVRPFPGHSGHLAYVIYTSGSTGLPKGAMVEQRGMVNHLYAKIDDLKLIAADVVAQTASQCFDISVWQFLAVLLQGGRVHILPDEITMDPQRLLEEVEEQGVTILEIVPSLLRAMLEQTSRPSLTRLRWLIPTGEALLPGLSREWFSQYPDIPMMNAYGPTECSDDVTHYPIYDPPDPAMVRVPIGRPIANTRLYVLSPHLRPAPIGVTGELWVGGIGVGRGYLNDPLRTAASFLPDVFAAQPGMRLYRTGDLARYLPDGNIEFLGRIDHQVKVRGFRIELGEIEAILRQQEAVREAVVVVREDLSGDNQLVAYLVPCTGAAPNREELCSFLSSKLPVYMVPSAFVCLEALPLTSTGKIDRKALPAPDVSQPQLTREFVEPETLVEKKLAELWSQVLGIEKISLHDNFFALGGHSLKATQVIYRLNNMFPINLPLRSLFEDPTVAGLALAVEEALVDMLEAKAKNRAS